MTNSEKTAIIDNKEKIINAFEQNGFNANVNIPPKSVDSERLAFDEEHITKRKHNTTKELAQGYIKNALISYTKDVQGVKYENYISRDGAAYVNTETNTIRTAFPSSEYNKGTKRIINTIDDCISAKENIK